MTYDPIPTPLSSAHNKSICIVCGHGKTECSALQSEGKNLGLSKVKVEDTGQLNNVRIIE